MALRGLAHDVLLLAVAAVSFCWCVFFFNDTATTEIYTLLYTLSLHDALPISDGLPDFLGVELAEALASPGWRSEEHTSELQSHSNISYAVFCLKKKKKTHEQKTIDTIRYKTNSKKKKNLE